MSTRHSDEEPIAHNAADELLDELLAGADADLHAALGDVVDLDAGLTAIVGSHGSKRPVTHARPIRSDVVKDSRLVPPRRRPRLLTCGGLVRGIIDLITFWVKLVPPKWCHAAISTTTVFSSRRQSLAGVLDQINALVDSLTKINRFAIVPKRRRNMQSCATRLVSLRKDLEDGEISRDEAKKVIAGVKLTLEMALKQQRSLRVSLPYFSTFPIGVALGIFTIYTGQLSYLFYATFGSLVILQLAMVEKSKSRKMGGLSKIYGKLTCLGRAVDRLFDDADDRDRDWSNLPC